MKIIYAGAPQFSVAPLQSIMNAGFSVAAVITQPDKPFGRKGILMPTPLKSFAQSQGIPVREYEKIRDNTADLASFGADLMVTCAYGQLLTQSVLDAFPRGVFTVHASLLPKYRGASPIAACILNGETHTGITVMKTDIGLDTGDMLLQRSLKIDPQDTTGTLSDRLSVLGGACIVEALRAIEKGTAVLTPQNHSEATLVKKMRKEHALLDFSQSAEAIVNTVRAMNPAPVAYTYLHGKTLNVFEAHMYGGAIEGAEEDFAAGTVARADKTGIYVRTGTCLVVLDHIQVEGGKRMRAADFVNGRKICAGDVLGGVRV